MRFTHEPTQLCYVKQVLKPFLFIMIILWSSIELYVGFDWSKMTRVASKSVEQYRKVVLSFVPVKTKMSLNSKRRLLTFTSDPVLENQFTYNNLTQYTHC